MSKLDELRRTSLGNIDESMGGGRAMRSAIPGVSPALPRAVPSKLQGVIRSGNAAEIPVEKIGPDDDQPREEFDEAALDRLAESLRSKGQLQPIRVRWSEERGQYLIICGERRWRAATRAGLATLSCIISDGPISPGELLALQCVENLLREDLTDMEQARAFRTLMDSNGWSTYQLAKELGIVQPSVVRAVALLKLPESIQEQVEQGGLSPATAYEVSKLGDSAEQVEVAARVMAEGLTRAETVEVVRQAASRPRVGGTKGRSAIKARPKRPTVRSIKTTSARVTVEFKKDADLAEVAVALREALSKVEAEQGDGQVAA